MPYLHTITTNTGQQLRIDREAVSDSALATVRPWLLELLSTGRRQPLPVPPLCHYSAAAFRHESGGLVATLYGPNGPHQPGTPALAGDGMPIVTIGIAQRSRHGADLWAMLTANLPTHPKAIRPRPPWCALAAHPAMLYYPDTAHWASDFAQCLAWSWLTNRPDLEAIK